MIENSRDMVAADLDVVDFRSKKEEEYAHIHLQQRKGRKCLTTVQGIKKDFSFDKILKDLKKQLCCNGNVVQDKDLGNIIQLQGDHRNDVVHFLVQQRIVVNKEQIKIHGF